MVIENTNKIWGLGFFLTCAVLAASYGLELLAHLNPCPLCLIQRYLLYPIALVLGIGIFYKNKKYRIYSLLVAITCSSIGIIVASKHIQLLNSPLDELGTCTASITRLIKIKPLLEVIQTIWRGSPECAEDGFRIMGLSLPIWSLITFISITGFNLLLFSLTKKRANFSPS